MLLFSVAAVRVSLPESHRSLYESSEYGLGLLGGTLVLGMELHSDKERMRRQLDHFDEPCLGVVAAGLEPCLLESTYIFRVELIAVTVALPDLARESFSRTQS